MKYIEALVLTGSGADRVYITTDLPSPFPMYSEPLTFSFDVLNGTGKDYVKKHFGLNAEVVVRGPKQ